MREMKRESGRHAAAMTLPEPPERPARDRSRPGGVPPVAGLRGLPEPPLSGLTAASGHPRGAEMPSMMAVAGRLTRGEVTALADRVKRALEAVPAGMMDAWTWKLSVASVLMLDYCETVADLSAMQGGDKALTRRARGYIREYRAFNEAHLLRDVTVMGDREAQGFEDNYAGFFGDMARGLSAEFAALDEGPRRLMVAIHQALAVYRAIRILALELDRRLARYGVHAPQACMLVQSEILRLGAMLPDFARGWWRDSDTGTAGSVWLGHELVTARVRTPAGEFA